MATSRKFITAVQLPAVTFKIKDVRQLQPRIRYFYGTIVKKAQTTDTVRILFEMQKRLFGPSRC